MILLTLFSTWAVATMAQLYDVINLGPVMGGGALLPVVTGLNNFKQDIMTRKNIYSQNNLILCISYLLSYTDRLFHKNAFGIYT